MSNQPFGYIILEGENEDKEITNLEVVEKPHLFYVKFTTTLQSLDCKNRNGRQYNGDALVKGLSDPNIAELIANKKWKGERDHPVTKDIQRIASVLSKYQSHYITKWWREGNLIKGNIETIDDGRYGTALARSILQGENPSFSLRALAMLEKKGTTTFVNSPPRVITYDEVNLPSHKEAYADPIKKNIISDGKREYTFEGCSQSGIITNRGLEIAIEAKDIKDMIINKSDNLKIVCESFDLDPASLKIGKDAKTLSVKRGGETMVFALESALRREIVNFW